MTTPLYPPVSFYFTVALLDPPVRGETSFLEVTGLAAEREVLEIKEGGENRFAHRVPQAAKYGNLVLKRGVLLPTSGFGEWFTGIIESNFDAPIKPRTVLVSLLNAAGKPLMTWSFINAWPLKWSVSDLGADKNELAIESIELVYSRFVKKAAS
jgi:phage tail-like protein